MTKIVEKENYSTKGHKGEDNGNQTEGNLPWVNIVRWYLGIPAFPMLNNENVLQSAFTVLKAS